MTQRKFKIGDRYTFNEGFTFEIIFIIEGKILFQGNWITGDSEKEIKDAYIAKVIIAKYECYLNNIVMLPFDKEDEVIFINNEIKVINNSNWNTICSRCGAPAYQGLLKIECSKKCI